MTRKPKYKVPANLRQILRLYTALARDYIYDYWTTEI